MTDDEKIKNNLRRIQEATFKPIYHDFSFTEMSNQVIPNSAATLQRIQEENDSVFQELAERRERLDNAIQQTAQESVAHTCLLENQLKEVKTQNELLQTNYNTLNALYEKVREESDSNKLEAIESRKATKKANCLSICAIVLSSLFSFISILIALLIK